MNILLSTIGRRTYMVKYFKEACKAIGEVHAANCNFVYPMQMADKYVVTPLIHDSNYIEFLLRYCIDHKIGAVFSFFDRDLLVLAKSKTLFLQHGIQLVVSDYDTTQLCNDKWLTYNFLNKSGISTPQTYISLDGCIDAISSQRLNFPVITKPRWGMSSIGVFQADNQKELEVLYEKTRGIALEIYPKHESVSNMDNCVIIQERMEGIEFGLDILNDLQGNFLGCVPKRKLWMRAGETDSAEIIESSPLSEIAMKLSRSIRHIGNLDVDLFFTKDNYSVIEMNGRFGGQYPFAHLAGVNYPRAIMNMLLGLPVYSDFLNFKPGIIGFKDLEPVILTHA
jgi:carbamoyl-phosphate synthase large subunit